MIDDQPLPASGFSRRGALGLAVGLGAVSAFSASPAAAALDIDNPADARQIYRKMRYRTDDGLVFSWVKGPHLAEVGADLMPAYGINLGSIQRVTHRADGGFDVRTLEVNFLTDPDTGKRITRYRNPITNEDLAVPIRPPRPSMVSYSRDNEIHAPISYQGADFEVTHFTPTILAIGGEIYVHDRSRARLSTGGRTDRILNEISTFSAPRAAVLDPRVTSVDAKVQSNDVTSWPSWLKMGATPGIMALYAVGGKAPSYDALPADWLAMMREAWPQIAANPIAALDAPLES